MAVEEALKYLDEAYALGEEELELLLAEDVENVAEKAERRGRLVEDALRVSSEGLADDGEDRFLERLRRLERQHGVLTAEARKLHERLREDLANLKQENKRISAYHGAHRPTPLIRYKYLDKES